MNRPLLYKSLTILALMTLLLIPLAMIKGLVYERQIRRDSVVTEIAQTSTGEQTVTGPFIVVPYKETVTEEKTFTVNGEVRTVTKDHNVQHYKYLLPEELHIDGKVRTEERYRGIFAVPVYTAHLRVHGTFTLAEHLGIAENPHKIVWGQASVVFGVSDIRGIQRTVTLKLNETPLTFEPGTSVVSVPKGIHAPLKPFQDFTAPQQLTLDIQIDLQGLKRLSFLPIGRDTHLKLASAWPHPSFEGRFLPVSREITDTGFTAYWETSFLASNMEQHFADCLERQNCSEFNGNRLTTVFIQPVDIYQQGERSLKYAILFVSLTFLAFFLFEILKALTIHPIQYGLVGAALALFYLLLLSLSEHITFPLAYLSASAACVSLLGFYVSFVLGRVRRGLGFGGAFAGLYGALYVLIRSEDHALLMGTLLLTVVLLVIMVITRKVNWYQVSRDIRDASLGESSTASARD